MAPILRKTPKSYRSSILYEFQLGRPIEEAYNNFRKHTKKQNFYYVEFAYWFNRFTNGKFDLDNESFDKKPLTFSDLPYDVLGEIVGKLDRKSRFSTRKVSRFLRNVVDDQPLHDEISILFEDGGISIKYGTHCVSYNQHYDKCRIRRKVLNGDFVDIALDDLAIVLKSPKLQLKLFQITFSPVPDIYNEKVFKFFESLKSPIHVKSVKFDSPEVQFVLPVLSLLKPGRLEEIGFDCMPAEMPANQLVKMDQWKQAKRFFTNSPMPVDIKEFFHFNQFDIRVPSESISADYVISLRNNLSKWTNFESCHITVVESVISIPVIKQIGEALGAEVVISDPRNSAKISHRHPIPGCKQFFEFSIDSYKLSICRTD